MKSGFWISLAVGLNNDGATDQVERVLQLLRRVFSKLFCMTSLLISVTELLHEASITYVTGELVFACVNRSMKVSPCCCLEYPIVESAFTFFAPWFVTSGFERCGCPVLCCLPVKHWKAGTKTSHHHNLQHRSGTSDLMQYYSTH